MSRFLYLAAAALLCAAAVAPAQVSVGKEFTLGAGDSAWVGGDGLVVGFERIAQESRCPSGVLCFWEGDAAARLWADHPGYGRIAFELHTYHGFPWSFTWGTYEIALENVAPYPVVDVPIDPKSYVVTLVVTGTNAPVETGTWGRIKALFGGD